MNEKIIIKSTSKIIYICSGSFFCISMNIINLNKFFATLDISGITQSLFFFTSAQTHKQNILSFFVWSRIKTFVVYPLTIIWIWLWIWLLIFHPKKVTKQSVCVYVYISSIWLGNINCISFLKVYYISNLYIFIEKNTQLKTKEEKKYIYI